MKRHLVKGRKEGLQQGFTQGVAQGKETLLNQGRQEGFEQGYRQGYAKGIGEGQIKGLTEGEQRGYKLGYEKEYKEGFDESSRLLGPRDELIKVVSYRLQRRDFGWLYVVGEIKNVSNKTLNVDYIEVAALDKNKNILKTESIPRFETLKPQDSAFFDRSFGNLPEAVDAKITIRWQ